ncbi:lysosome membrane protein 2 [Galendromus occidentalis]|uniref:Scavenger receptor class B member 1 n=1 Tax=Galendromus occidentalis TaxID=34638 RepID=A0AAJ6QXR7_9ACAR|nr:lysosome membrane protein 2 [Galendromus occidentalis]
MADSFWQLTEGASKFCRDCMGSVGKRYDAMTAKSRNVKTKEKIESTTSSSRCCCFSYRICSILLLILACVMTGVATVLFTQFDKFFDNALRDQMHLGPNGLVFPAWRVSELRTNMRLYLFNITNPDEVMLGDKPILREIGPYTWKIHMDKFDINFYPNYTLSYRENKWFEFLPDQSVGTYDDIVTTVNVPYAAVAQRLKGQNSFAKSTATFTLNGLGQNLMHYRRVGELTFEGYPDFLILVASAVEKGKEEESGLGSFLGAGFRFVTNLLVDQNLQGNFGYFIDRNNTDDGVVTIFTGEDERSKINKVDVVNGRKELTTWPVARCNKITGTMGHLRPPASGEKPVDVFVPDLCRSLPLRYERESMYEGLSTLRFVAGKETFDNSKTDACFAGPRNFSSGVMDIGPCKKDAPLVVSFPHYLYADDKHLDSVVGMNPKKEKHQFYLESDPLTGVTVSVRARFQVGVILERVFGLGNLGRIFEGNIPLFWQELQLEALPPTVFQLKLLRDLPSYAKQAAVAMVVMAIVTGMISVFLAHRDWRNGRQMKVVPERSLPVVEQAYTNHVYENQDEAVRYKVSPVRPQNGTNLPKQVPS